MSMTVSGKIDARLATKVDEAAALAQRRYGQPYQGSQSQTLQMITDPGRNSFPYAAVLNPVE